MQSELAVEVPESAAIDHAALQNSFCDFLNSCPDHRSVAFPEIAPTSGFGQARVDIFQFERWTSNPKLTIYEVKVSRADFLSDIRSDKWRKYLPFCHRFYFVFPVSLPINREEIPEPAGAILWDAKAQRKRYLTRTTVRHSVDWKFSIEFLYKCMERLLADEFRPLREQRRLDALREMAEIVRDPNYRSQLAWAWRSRQDRIQELEAERMCDARLILNMARVLLAHGIEDLPMSYFEIIAEGKSSDIYWRHMKARQEAGWKVEDALKRLKGGE